MRNLKGKAYLFEGKGDHLEGFRSGFCTIVKP